MTADSQRGGLMTLRITGSLEIQLWTSIACHHGTNKVLTFEMGLTYFVNTMSGSHRVGVRKAADPHICR